MKTTLFITLSLCFLPSLAHANSYADSATWERLTGETLEKKPKTEEAVIIPAPFEEDASPLPSPEPDSTGYPLEIPETAPENTGS